MVFNIRVAEGAENASQGQISAITAPLSPDAVRAYVINAAKKAGVNYRKVDWIVGHESQYGQNMLGDDGQSRGYWMIDSKYHDVSDACADDLVCSTDWSLKQILAGHIKWWTTYAYCKLWYTNCPF